jgi:hypothetical protein
MRSNPCFAPYLWYWVLGAAGNAITSGRAGFSADWAARDAQHGILRSNRGRVRLPGCRADRREGDIALLTNLVEELVVGSRSFRFPLCRKPALMGTVQVDHWWMDVRRLYGQRGRSETMSQTVVDYFWALCQREGTDRDPEVQESYIQARLLPFARSNAARKIVVDAHLARARNDQKEQAEQVRELETMLQKSRSACLTMTEFQRQSGQVIGPPELSAEARQLYEAFCQQFLGEARDALRHQGEAGLDVARARWAKALAEWGRRGGHALEKQILDVLSYEGRAALHRCYSAVWCELIPHLVRKYQLDQPSVDFLALWHLDHVQDAVEDVPARFHLFHGHIFGLHPVGALLLGTTVGRELVGEWLSRADPQAQGRLLNAMSVALHVYALRREATAEDRRRRPKLAGDCDEWEDDRCAPFDR